MKNIDQLDLDMGGTNGWSLFRTWRPSILWRIWGTRKPQLNHPLLRESRHGHMNPFLVSPWLQPWNDLYWRRWCTWAEDHHFQRPRGVRLGRCPVWQIQSPKLQFSSGRWRWTKIQTWDFGVLERLETDFGRWYLEICCFSAFPSLDTPHITICVGHIFMWVDIYTLVLLKRIAVRLDFRQNDPWGSILLWVLVPNSIPTQNPGESDVFFFFFQDFGIKKSWGTVLLVFDMEI